MGKLFKKNFGNLSLREKLEVKRLSDKDIEDIRKIDSKDISNKQKIFLINKLDIPKFAKDRFISHYRREEDKRAAEKLFREGKFIVG